MMFSQLKYLQSKNQFAFAFQIAANVQIQSESPEAMRFRFRHGELEKRLLPLETINYVHLYFPEYEGVLILVLTVSHLLI